MTMRPTPSNQYHIVSRWRLEATPEEIDDLMQDEPESISKWWPAAFLAVQGIAAGDGLGRGKKVRVHGRGWMPHTVGFEVEVTEWRPAERVVLEATGDFEGSLTCTLRPQNGGYLVLNFDWRVVALKPFIRYFSWLLKPLFRSNHRWAMAKGRRSLQIELARRRAAKGDPAPVTVPPGPAFVQGLLYPRTTEWKGSLARYLSFDPSRFGGQRAGLARSERPLRDDLAH
jgi:hypothetical protein